MAGAVGGLDGIGDIERFLATHETKTVLRFITCGSVDDGKSTLIGRLLYESQMLYEDQLDALARDSKTSGTQGDALDFALLVDGLAAEREQGITIDVAYRFFSTEKRKFIVADTPGHEQYTRNMATGASTADLAVVMIDARKGVLAQTRRHSIIVSLLGVKTVALAVNKMDLVDFDRGVFDRIVGDYRAFARRLGLSRIDAFPISALRGDNIVTTSARTPWYDGPSILEHLETVKIPENQTDAPFVMPVQWVNRPNLDFRGFSGRIAAGVVRTGDRVASAPSGKHSRVARIVTADGDLPVARAGQSITLTLEDEIDVSRGDALCAADQPAAAEDQFECKLLWMSETALLPGRPYLLKLAAATAQAQITTIKHRIGVDDLSPIAAKTLELNEIGVCNLSLDRKLPHAAYQENRALGGFILIDRVSHETVALGMIDHALRRARDVQAQGFDVDMAARAEIKLQKPVTLWLTGLPGAGKSTIANALEARLNALGKHTYILDGGNLRRGLNRDLGFTDADRVENIRRVGEVCRLMVDAGLIVIAAFISPFRAERELARERVGDERFWEIYVSTPLDIAEARDGRGLYKRARAGDIAHFTGVTSAYEPPERPRLTVDAATMTPEAAAAHIFDALMAAGVLERR